MTGFRKHIRSLAGALVLTLLSAPLAVVQAESTAPEVELTGVERLLAMEEMKNLRLTFCRALDARNWSALRSTMADDFELYFAHTDGPDGEDLRPPIKVSSADEMVALARQLIPEGAAVFHICTMPQFDYVGTDRARAEWFINGFGEIAGQGGLGFERVVEDYVNIDGKWLIRKADARVQGHAIFPEQAGEAPATP